MRYLLIIIILLSSCAKRSAPTGGEGDITPPVLLSSTPESGSLNFSSKEISLTFSEWIEPNSAKNGITIFPIIDSGFEISVRRKNITIIPKSPLSKDITYHLSVNSELKDYSNNSISAPFEVLFSTGNSMDSSSISGRINDDSLSSKNLVKISLFRKSRVKDNDLLLLKSPDYLSQADSNGCFKVNSIANDTYRIIGFIDGNNDNLITPLEKIYIGKQFYNSTSKNAITLIPATCDTTSPKITELMAKSPNILVGNNIGNLNKNVIINDKKEEITVIDSSNFIVELKTPLTNTPYSAIFTHKATVKTDDSTYLPEITDTVKFNGTVITDSSVPNISKISIVNRLSNSPHIEIVWDEIVITSSKIVKAIPFTIDTNSSDSIKTLVFDSTKSVKFRVTPSLSKKTTIKAIDSLEKGKTYQLSYTEIDVKSLTKVPFNFLDSTIDSSKFQFKVETADKFAKLITLTLPNNGYDKNRTLFNLKGPISKIEQLNSLGKFITLKDVPVGKYSITLFNDINGNRKADLGSLFPFNTGEEIFYFSDTIVAQNWKKKWTVEYILNPINNCKIDSSKIITDSLVQFKKQNN